MSDIVHNERQKLLATAANNLGVGAIISGFVMPLAANYINSFASALIWTGIGRA
jgi:hypothetical protein